MQDHTALASLHQARCSACNRSPYLGLTLKSDGHGNVKEPGPASVREQGSVLTN